jgi:hypothetical protein
MYAYVCEVTRFLFKGKSNEGLSKCPDNTIPVTSGVI